MHFVILNNIPPGVGLDAITVLGNGMVSGANITLFKDPKNVACDHKYYACTQAFGYWQKHFLLLVWGESLILRWEVLTVCKHR